MIIFFILISLYLFLLLTTRGGDEYLLDQDVSFRGQTVPENRLVDGAGHGLYLVSIRPKDWGSTVRE